MGEGQEEDNHQPERSLQVRLAVLATEVHHRLPAKKTVGGEAGNNQ